jgi:hypothetical protein
MSSDAQRKAAVARATVTEYEYEPVPGLPEALPEGEVILWQGAPRVPVLARRAFHVRKVAVYFLIVAAVSLYLDLSQGAGIGAALGGLTWIAVAAASAIAVLWVLARSMARATLYTITNRRVVLRFGVAIPMTLNLPYSKVVSAALRDNGDGSGDIPLRMSRSGRVPYWVLWPHARPWHLAPAQPMLRAIPEAARVAGILAAALTEHAEAHGAPEAQEQVVRKGANGLPRLVRNPGTGLPAH